MTIDIPQLSDLWLYAWRNWLMSEAPTDYRRSVNENLGEQFHQESKSQ